MKITKAYKCDICNSLDEPNGKKGVNCVVSCGDIKIVIKDITRSDEKADICEGCVYGLFKDSSPDEES